MNVHCFKHQRIFNAIKAYCASSHRLYTFFFSSSVCKRWNYVVDMPAAFHHMAFYIPVEADVTVKSQRRKKRKHDEEQECQKSVSIFNGKSIHQYNRALSTVAQRGKPHVRSLLFYGNFFPGSETKGRLWGNQACTFDGCKIRGRLLKEFVYGEKEYCQLRQVAFVNCSIFIGELAGRWMIFERIKPEIILQNVALREIVRFFAFYESFDRFAEIPVVITGKEKLDVSSFLKSKPELEEKFKKNIDPDYFDFNIHKEISKTVLQNDKNVCMLLMPLLEKYVPQLSSSEVLAWKDTLTKKRCLPRTLSSTSNCT